MRVSLSEIILSHSERNIDTAINNNSHTLQINDCVSGAWLSEVKIIICEYKYKNEYRIKTKYVYELFTIRITLINIII